MDERTQGEEGDEIESAEVVEDIDLAEDDSDDVAGGSTGGVPLNRPVVGMSSADPRPA